MWKSGPASPEAMTPGERVEGVDQAECPAPGWCPGERLSWSGVLRRAWQISPAQMFGREANTMVSFGVEGTVFWYIYGPHLEGPGGQESGDKSLKTKPRVRDWGVARLNGRGRVECPGGLS